MLNHELQELKDYWSKKYPTILVNLWSNQDGTKHFGMMMASEQNVDLSADTIGELISQGEAFLRQLK